ncbi:helix-turn-helix transcriptional regulator [Pseudomonas abyssi]|uniref:Cro/Cl family transcriptional regulator n=1 Tax=Pseudomonas abyssi TaxID=170540 RepID=A0A395RBF0_9PSED|nr:helix-turn-helix transcriptional regulator [Halopseudomonas gallaeciensis]MAG65635.1 transcriptional regulator [Pseudomonadales bacterium]RGP57152.1 Cro/Cl family transcriptional regulator [Halopseudomonas gallaeciensis]
MKNRLRVLRAEAAWTQADLAERLGVSRQAVNALETEKHDPSLDLAYRISALFDRPVEAIFDNAHRASTRGAPGDSQG